MCHDSGQSVVDYLYASDIPFKNLSKLAQHQKQQEKNSCQEVFFYHNIKVKENVFLRARSEEGIV